MGYNENLCYLWQRSVFETNVVSPLLLSQTKKKMKPDFSEIAQKLYGWGEHKEMDAFIAGANHGYSLAMEQHIPPQKDKYEIKYGDRWIEVDEDTYLYAIHNGREGRINDGELINHWQEPEQKEETQEYIRGFEDAKIAAARIITENWSQCITQHQVDILNLKPGEVIQAKPKNNHTQD
jgi:hypothetical protein